MVRDLDINQTPKMEKDREWIMISATPHVNDDDGNSGGRRRKKLRLTKDQSHILEESFIQNHTLTHVSIYIIQLYGSVYVLFALREGEREMEKEKERERESNIFMMIKSADYVLVG